MNQRPLGYEPSELPGCSTPRRLHSDGFHVRVLRQARLNANGQSAQRGSRTPRRLFLKQAGMPIPVIWANYARDYDNLPYARSKNFSGGQPFGNDSIQCEREDLNLRHTAYQAGALTWLSYTRIVWEPVASLRRFLAPEAYPGSPWHRLDLNQRRPPFQGGALPG